nr:MAG TPA: hypothetical protein [Caudoviricetes sp.]
MKLFIELLMIAGMVLSAVLVLHCLVIIAVLLA